jgi:archaellum component FlaC
MTMKKFVQRGNVKVPQSVLDNPKPKESFFEHEEAKAIRNLHQRKRLANAATTELNAERFAEQQKVLREMQKRVHELQDEMDRVKKFADDIAEGLEIVVGVFQEREIVTDDWESNNGKQP